MAYNNNNNTISNKHKSKKEEEEVWRFYIQSMEEIWEAPSKVTR